MRPPIEKRFLVALFSTVDLSSFLVRSFFSSWKLFSFSYLARTNRSSESWKSPRNQPRSSSDLSDIGKGPFASVPSRVKRVSIFHSFVRVCGSETESDACCGEIKIDNTSRCSDSLQMSLKLLENQSMRWVGGVVFVFKIPQRVSRS